MLEETRMMQHESLSLVRGLATFAAKSKRIECDLSVGAHRMISLVLLGLSTRP